MKSNEAWLSLTKHGRETCHKFDCKNTNQK